MAKVRAFYDVIIIGAGAAGLMCAIEAGKRGRKVLVIDHSAKPAEKIRISGGGRCNFTNIHTSPKNYISNNPHFCVSALSRYKPADFINLVKKHSIAFHEKTLGQLFCDGSAQEIIKMLIDECKAAGVEISLATKVNSVTKPEFFRITTGQADYESNSLVIASGGLSIPKMGASNFGYEIAKQFGFAIISQRPGLVPFTLSETELAKLGGLSGVSFTGEVSCNNAKFKEGVLFTHRGLSGPAILQISSYWRQGQGVIINMAPATNAMEFMVNAKNQQPRQETATALSRLVPKRLASIIAGGETKRLAEMPNKALAEIARAVNSWEIIPNGTEGYRTAEVTLGGVDTNELSSKTMEAKKVPGLYFIGEVVDVTGHLGGYNFQWAWASGFAAGQYA